MSSFFLAVCLWNPSARGQTGKTRSVGLCTGLLKMSSFRRGVCVCQCMFGGGVFVLQKQEILLRKEVVLDRREESRSFSGKNRCVYLLE